MSELPKLILIFSGKRKSGKDYITDLLKEKLGDSAVIIRLSGPLKQCFATTHGLDYEQLLSAGEYKEKYRVAMLEWSEAIRREDYTYFCKAAISKYSAEKFPVWIISDARRLTDLQFFRENYGSKVRTVRISAPESVREGRGWKFTPGVDDMETECGLDTVEEWDFRIENCEPDSGASLIQPLTEFVNSNLS